MNIVGSFAMGLLAGYFAFRPGIDQHMRLFLTTGILGGFTTFSAFSLDTALLVERHAYGLAAGYIVGSVAASLSALFFGLALFRARHGHCHEHRSDPDRRRPAEQRQVIIEVPVGGEPVKYEFDKKSGALVCRPHPPHADALSG